MSAELDMIRKAVTILRERAEACEAWEGDDESPPWADEFDPVAHEREHGYYSPDVAYIATMHPGVGLALADWLEVTAGGHEPGGTEELVLHPDTPCSVCEESGHEVEVCAGCFPSWDGLDCRVAYPCVEVRNALPLVRLIVGEQS